MIWEADGLRTQFTPRRVVLEPRPTALEGFEVGLFAMTLGAHRAFCGRAAFELVGAQIPQRGVQTAGVVPGFQILKDGHACLFGLIECREQREDLEDASWRKSALFDRFLAFGRDLARTGGPLH